VSDLWGLGTMRPCAPLDLHGVKFRTFTWSVARMGSRGPAPTPTRVLELRGTFRGDRHGGVEPKPAAPRKVPPAPKHLGDEARRIWKRLAKELLELELLTGVDLVALEGYCVTYERAIAAEAIVASEGRTVATAQGRKRHPELLTAEKARADLRRYDQEFGFTPSARARLRGAPAKKTPAANPFGQVAAVAAKRG
jgi:P27 family predicted phage terminase small subunit